MERMDCRHRARDRRRRVLRTAVVASGVALASFEQARPTLEDVFLELVGPADPDELDGRGFVRPREASER